MLLLLLRLLRRAPQRFLDLPLSLQSACSVYLSKFFLNCWTFRSLVRFRLSPRICRNQFYKIFVNMQLILKFVFIFTYNFNLLISVSCAENCLPLDDCDSLNQLAEFQSELQNITAESVESYIEEQRCKNTSDVLTYECPEIYDGEFHNF